jgi:chaperone required for assembly of F1-ATPase
MTSHDQRLRSPARALLVVDQPVLAEIVKLALNHPFKTICRNPRENVGSTSA